MAGKTTVYKLKLVNETSDLLEEKVKAKNMLAKNTCNDIKETSKNTSQNQPTKFEWMTYYQSN